MVYVHNGILPSHEKDKNNAPGGNMDAARDSHSKWSKKKRQMPYDIIFSTAQGTMSNLLG